MMSRKSYEQPWGISKLSAAIAGLCRRKSASIRALCLQEWDKGNADNEGLWKEWRKRDGILVLKEESG